MLRKLVLLVLVGIASVYAITRTPFKGDPVLACAVVFLVLFAFVGALEAGEF